jgi:hypothetical protein
MCKSRYKQLYHPLKLCYDTSRLSKVAEPDEASSQDSDLTNYKPFTSLLGAATAAETFYQYLPILSSKTYCGVLYRTLVRGHPWLSTIGGLIEINSAIYALTCEHAVSRSTPVTGPSVSETLVEGDFGEDVNEALVFGEPLEDAGAIDTDERARGVDMLTSLARDQGVDWENLPIAGAAREGPEWCLVPLEGNSVLPNFVERPSAVKGKGTGDPERYYLEESSEPRAGCPAWVVTASAPGYIGEVHFNPSYIIGAGSGLIESWTVGLEQDQGEPRWRAGASRFRGASFQYITAPVLELI